MTSSFRLIDSGVRDGRMQIAETAALIEMHAAGQMPDLVRFLRFPPTVLIGRHQIMSSEVHVERCRAEGVGLVRRVTGGGTIYLDEGQVGWELIFDRRAILQPTLSEYARTICEAVASGLSDAFGIDARYRPRNDIEVGGRKISGTGGYFSGSTLVYQGTVLVDMDATRMARLINIPAVKLARHGASRAEGRVVTLKELLGEAPSVLQVQQAVLDGLSGNLGIEARRDDTDAPWLEMARRLHADEYGTEAFVFGDDPTASEDVLEGACESAGGTVRAMLRLDGTGGNRRIREVLLAGDFFISPPRTIYDLEAALRGVPVGAVADAIAAHFRGASIDMLSVSPTDFGEAIRAAIACDVA